MDNSEFSVLQADVILSSTTEEKKVVDIRSKIVQIDFYENLSKPYIDASVILMDDFGLRTSLSIQGTERLRLVLGNEDTPEVPIIVKYFFFSRIMDSQKANERAELLSLELVEDHVYVNAVKSISRSFESNIEDMIENIFDRDLGKTINRDRFQPSAQGVRKTIIPYLSPIEAIYWLNTRATTATGAPFYVYSNLYTDDITMSDLESLLRDKVINEDYPFIYNEAGSTTDLEQEPVRKITEIKSFQELEPENSLALYEEGAIGSYYANIDAGTGLVQGSHISVRDILTEMYFSEMITGDASQSIFDPSLEIDGRLSDEYNSLFIHQVTSSNTYNQFQSYHDESPQLDENNNPIESKLKVKNKIIRQILKKNRIEISMNGKFFFNGQVHVGQKIRALFVNPDVTSEDGDTKSMIDFRKSGDFLILAMHHRMVVGGAHVTTLRVTKLSDLPEGTAL